MVFLQTYYFENYNVNTDYYVTLCALGFSLPASSAKDILRTYGLGLDFLERTA